MAQLQILNVTERPHGTLVHLLPKDKEPFFIDDMFMIGYHTWKIAGMEEDVGDGSVSLLLRQEMGTGRLVKGENIYSVHTPGWKNLERPGYFGRRRDEKIKGYNDKYGPGNWRMVWIARDIVCDFEEACRRFYEESYYQYLRKLPNYTKELCSYGECYDNDVSNISSGLDYTHQEAFSTHIQDIAVRNVMAILGLRFQGSMQNLLQIRSRDSNGYKFGPGNVPFFEPTWITLPSLVPEWAKPDSVEDFWQSNKWIQVRR